MFKVHLSKQTEEFDPEEIEKEFVRVIEEMGISEQNRRSLATLPIENKYKMVQSRRKMGRTSEPLHVYTQQLRKERAKKNEKTVLVLIKKIRHEFLAQGQANVERFLDAGGVEEVLDLLHHTVYRKESAAGRNSGVTEQVHHTYVQEDTGEYTLIDQSTKTLKVLLNNNTAMCRVCASREMVHKILNIFPSKYLSVYTLSLEVLSRTGFYYDVLYDLMGGYVQMRDESHVVCRPMCSVKIHSVFKELYYNLSVGNVPSAFVSLLLSFLCRLLAPPEGDVRSGKVFIANMFVVCGIKEILSALEANDSVKEKVTLLRREVLENTLGAYVREKCDADEYDFGTIAEDYKGSSTFRYVVNILDILYRTNSRHICDVSDFIKLTLLNLMRPSVGVSPVINANVEEVRGSAREKSVEVLEGELRKYVEEVEALQKMLEEEKGKKKGEEGGEKGKESLEGAAEGLQRAPPKAPMAPPKTLKAPPGPPKPAGASGTSGSKIPPPPRAPGPAAPAGPPAPPAPRAPQKQGSEYSALSKSLKRDAKTDIFKIDFLGAVEKDSLWADVNVKEMGKLFSPEDFAVFTRGKSLSLKPSLPPSRARFVHTVFPDKKGNALNIALARVPVPLADLKDSLLVLRDQDFTENLAVQLLNNYPTEEEFSSLTLLRDGYLLAPSRDKDLSYGKAEIFFMEALQIPHLRERLTSINLKLTIDLCQSQLEASLSVLTEVSSLLLTNKKLHLLLKMVLVITNILNSGTAIENAKGYKIDSLKKVIAKKDIMALVRQKTAKHHKDVKGLLPILNKIDNISTDVVDSEYRDITSKYSAVEKANDPAIKEHLSRYREGVSRLGERYKEWTANKSKIRTFFNEPSPTEEIFKTILLFVKFYSHQS